MHCPKCGQQQISEDTRFCSRCGLLLTGIAAVVANDGVVRAPKASIAGEIDSPKRRGVKLGFFTFLLMFLAVPIAAMITLALNMEPFLPVIAIFIFGGGGILRMIYALMFESGIGNPIAAGKPVLQSGIENRDALPPAQSIPASAYSSPAGSWRDTNDLQRTPGSVTDSTTKLLQNDDPDQ
jgi:hypothetical protein